MPTTHNNNVDLYYEVHGLTDPSAPTILFAHGAGGNAASWWQQIPEFSEDHRIVAFDHRGFGRSKCTPEDFHVRNFEHDARAVLDAAGVEQAIVVGQSMGGWTGLRLAARYPDRVRALVLSNTPGAVQHPALTEAMANTARSLRGDSFLGTAISQEFAKRNPRGAYLYSQIAAFSSPRPDLRSLTSSEGAVSAEDVLALRNKRIHMICSDMDALFPADVLQIVADKLNATIEVVVGAGHSTYFEMPDEYNKRLRAFIASL